MSYTSANGNTEKNFLYFFSYTPRNGNAEKIICISGNGNFASFLRKFLNL